MIIRKGQLNDLIFIEELYTLCTKHLIKQEIFQWDETYPSNQIIKEDLERESLTCIYLNGNLLAVYVLDEIQTEQYDSVNWNYTEPKIGVIHRMAVDPSSQGIGIGIKLLKLAEKEALEKNYKSIRLDAFKENNNLLAFYKKRGYTEVGEIPLEYTSGPFVCFEKNLI